MGRQAYVWKDQGNLTDLGLVTTKLKMEDQLRVRLALRMMRKAHTHGSRLEGDGLRRRTTAGERRQASRPCRSAKGRVTSDTENDRHNGNNDNVRSQHEMYNDQDPIHMRTIKEIKKQALVSFQLTKDRIRVQNESKKFGQLRPICADVIQEVKEFEEKRISEARERRQRAIESRTPAWSPAPPSGGLTGPSVESVVTAETSTSSNPKAPGTRGSRNRNGADEKGMHQERLFRVIRRHDLLPTKSVAALPLQELRGEDDNPVSSLTASSSAAAVISGRGGASARDEHSTERFLSARSQSSRHSPRRDTVSTAATIHEHLVLSLPPDESDNVSVSNSSMQSEDSIVRQARATSLLWQGHRGGGSEVASNTSSSNIAATGSTRQSGSPENRKKSSFLQRGNSFKNLRPQLLRKGSTMGLLRSSHLNGNEDETQDEGDEDELDEDDDRFASEGRPMLARQSTLSRIKQRSSTFGIKMMDQDERIQRALKAKEAQQHEKEERLLKKIHEREENAQQRQQLQQQNEKRKVWLSLIGMLGRIKYFMDIVAHDRYTREWGGMKSYAKRAIHVIKKWWRRMKIKLVLLRHPRQYGCFRRVLLMHVTRLRLRRKRRAIALIKNFLDDCSGLSETMRKIYSFRQSVIKMQRWFRSWNDVQIFRVKMLWAMTEKKFKENARAERIAKLKNEKSALKAMAQMEGFAAAMVSINRRRRELSRVLEEQEEEGNRRRVDIVDQIEALDTFKKKHEEEMQLRLQQANSKIPSTPTLGRKQSSLQLTSPVGLPTPTLSATQSSYTLTRQVGNNLFFSSKPASGDLMSNTYYICLGIIDRYGPDKSLDYWMKKVRASPATVRTYEMLRALLMQQRRRHILQQQAKHTRRVNCPVEIADLQKFLHDPKDNSMSHQISHSIGDMNATSVMAQDIINSPFLLLTQGGLEAIDMIIRTNKNLKFY